MRLAIFGLAVAAIFFIGREFYRSAHGGASGGGKAGATQVVLYTTSWCGICRKARTYLRRRRVPFVDKVIDRDPEAAREFAAKRVANGFRNSVPVLDVKGEIVTGFNADAYERALRSFGY